MNKLILTALGLMICLSIFNIQLSKSTACKPTPTPTEEPEKW